MEHVEDFKMKNATVPHMTATSIIKCVIRRLAVHLDIKKNVLNHKHSYLFS